MNGFTIYREYYDLITLLSEIEQQELLLAISKYMFEDIEPILNDRQQKIFINLKRPLDISKRNSLRSKGHGAPIGNNNAKKQTKNKPKTNQKQTAKQTHQDVNVIVNDNVNVINSIFSTIENNFGRTIAPLEAEVIKSWIDDNISEELIVYAIQIAVCNNAYSVKYVDTILQNWKRKKITKVVQAKNDNDSFKRKKEFKNDERDMWENE